MWDPQKSHRGPFLGLGPAYRSMRRVLRIIRPPRSVRLSLAFAEIFRRVEGGSLVVRLPQFGGSLEIGSHSDILRRILTRGGEYEPDVVALIRDRIDPGRDAIDIGANVGLFTLLLANLVAPVGRVLAIEPTEGALAYLYRNVERNHQSDRVVIFEGAVADRRGTATINVIAGMEEYSSIGSMVHPAIAGKEHRPLSVPCETVDHLTERFALRPGFIKIDTEGSEYAVLVGCRRTIEEHRPVILCEAWPEALVAASGGVPGAVAGLLESHGYVVSEPARRAILAVPQEEWSAEGAPNGAGFPRRRATTRRTEPASDAAAGLLRQQRASSPDGGS
jgi:FkbM family methyltransferase